MGNTIRVPGPSGKPMDGTDMPFRTGSEDFNEYLLDDGTVLKIKLVVTRVVRIDDLYDDQGDPVYVAQSTNVIVASVPDKLKKDQGEQSS